MVGCTTTTTNNNSTIKPAPPRYYTQATTTAAGLALASLSDEILEAFATFLTAKVDRVTLGWILSVKTDVFLVYSFGNESNSGGSI